MPDNGSAYKSHAWRDACTELGIRPKKTRPYRPQTSGKADRFRRTMTDGRAYAASFTPNTPVEPHYPPGPDGSTGVHGQRGHCQRCGNAETTRSSVRMNELLHRSTVTPGGARARRA
jgi:transposase InsO family protein